MANPNSPQKHVWRARVVLLSAKGLGKSAIAAATCKSRPTVGRWQTRFRETGIGGLLKGKTKPPGKQPLAKEKVARVLALTAQRPPGGATHWSGRRMAKAAGVSLRPVQRIWAAHNLQPHRVRTFKLSKDPEFAGKLAGVVGLYVNPPQHAIVLSIDEKSQIQAQGRTQPGLPLKPGKCATMTHDYKRHGAGRKGHSRCPR